MLLPFSPSSPEEMSRNSCLLVQNDGIYTNLYKICSKMAQNLCILKSLESDILAIVKLPMETHTLLLLQFVCIAL